MDNIWEDYLAALSFVDLANVDRSMPEASRKLRDGLAGINLTEGRIAGARNVPPGFQWIATTKGHRGAIQRFAWSPDGRYLASPEQEGVIGLWDVEQNERREEEFRDQTASIVAYTCVSWSPSAPHQELLAAGDTRGLVRIWNARTQDLLQTLSHPIANTGTIPEYSGGVRAIAWSPTDGNLFAVALSKEVLIWSWNSAAGRARHLRTLDKHMGTVTSLAWSPDGKMLASASNDQSIFLWNTVTWRSFHHLQGHQGAINSLAWLMPQEIVASASDDKTIRLWNFVTGEPVHSPLEGHRAAVTDIAFFDFHNNCFLASKSHDDTVHLWYHENWLEVATLAESSPPHLLSNLAFHPSKPLLATLSKDNLAMRIWKLDFDALARAVPPLSTAYYCSAKVVLVGESGTGKTSLWRRLQELPFQDEYSTDTLQVAHIPLGSIPDSAGKTETRELYLWDLAGQSHVRIIHQLYLNDVAVALVVFNAAIDDPFAPIYYWVWALKQAQLARKRKGYPFLPMKMFLVAGRTDVSKLSMSLREHVKKIEQELDFDYFLSTISKDPEFHIYELGMAIREAIDWSAFRQAIDTNLAEAGTSIDLYRQMRYFLQDKENEPQGKIFATIKELYEDFQSTYKCVIDELEFRTCMNWMETQGLVRRYTFDDYVNSDDYLLFKHGCLGIYATALMDAIGAMGKKGHIVETQIRKRDFPLAADQRIPNKESERFILLALGQELLRQEFAFRQEINDRWYLVFPSLCQEEDEEQPEPKGQKVSFGFKGAPRHIYATLIVRLARSGRFYLDRLRENKATYTARSMSNTTYGIMLKDRGRGEGTLILFFQGTDGEAQMDYPNDRSLEFEGFVESHLKTRALPESVRRHDIFTCHTCGALIPDARVENRRISHLNWISCDGCDEKISLVRMQTPDVQLNIIETMNLAADAACREEARDFSEAARHDTIEGHYLVYFSYLDEYVQIVRDIGERVTARGNTAEVTISPFLRRNLMPGVSTLKALGKEIEQAQVALLFVGGNDSENHLNGQESNPESVRKKKALRDMEEEIFLVKPMDAAIPVILPGTPPEFSLSGFLSGRFAVDFRIVDPDPIDELIRGITRRR